MIRAASTYQDIVHRRLNFLTHSIDGYKKMRQGFYENNCLPSNNKSEKYNLSMINKHKETFLAEREFIEERQQLIKKNEIVNGFFDQLTNNLTI